MCGRRNIAASLEGFLRTDLLISWNRTGRDGRPYRAFFIAPESDRFHHAFIFRASNLRSDESRSGRVLGAAVPWPPLRVALHFLIPEQAGLALLAARGQVAGQLGPASHVQLIGLQVREYFPRP